MMNVFDINSRKERMMNRKNNKTVNEDTLTIKYDLGTLDAMCAYVVSENSSIKRSNLINMEKLFAVLDRDKYINNIELYERFDFIRRVLHNKLTMNMNNKHIILMSSCEGMSEGVSAQMHSLPELGNGEVDWIAEKVSETLKYAYLHHEINTLTALCADFKMDDHTRVAETVTNLETSIANMQNKFRKARVQKSGEQTFSLMPGQYEEAMTTFYNELMAPSNMLRTNMVGFDYLIGGGLESTRLYILAGLTGGGKSLTLLNIAYQIKMSNKFYKPKDPTKTPAVVYLTMENSVRETVSRLFSLVTNGKKMTEFELEDVLSIMREEGKLNITGESNIDIIVKYMPDRSVDTSYLYTMADELEDEGYECICLIQDHIKRIRSVERITDQRLELGAVVNEMKTFATLKDIPVLTNTHINREGARKADDNSAKAIKQQDTLSVINRGDIGESFLMLDNADVALFTMMEYNNSKDTKYMGFKRVKTRVEVPEIDLIYHPFTGPNSIKLVEDRDMATPVYRETLVENVNTIDTKNFNNGITKQENKPSTPNQLEGLEERNAYGKIIQFSGTTYTQGSVRDVMNKSIKGTRKVLM